MSACLGRAQPLPPPGDAAKRDARYAAAPRSSAPTTPWYEPARWTGYQVALPGQAVARCNPVNAPKDCADGELAGDKAAP